MKRYLLYNFSVYVRLFMLALLVACGATARATETVEESPGAKVSSDSTKIPARAYLKEIWYDERDAFNGISILDDGNWIEMNGAMYRVVSTSRSDEEVLFLCIEDVPAPFMFLNAPWSPESESSQAHSISKMKVLPEVIPDVYAVFSLQSPALERMFACGEFVPLNFEPEIASPPPKIS
jgi:hypothetical protein